MTAPTVEDAERAAAEAARARAGAALAERELNNDSLTPVTDVLSRAAAATRAATVQMLNAKAEEAEAVAAEMWNRVPGGRPTQQINMLVGQLAGMGNKMDCMMEAITSLAQKVAKVTRSNAAPADEIPVDKTHAGATGRARATIPIDVTALFSREKMADAPKAPLNADVMARMPLEELMDFQADLRRLMAAGIVPPQHAQLLLTALMAVIEAAGGSPPPKSDAKRVARLHQIAAEKQMRETWRLRNKSSKAADNAVPGAKPALAAAAPKKAGSRPAGAKAAAAAPSAPSGRDPMNPWGKIMTVGGGTAARGTAAAPLPGAEKRETAQAAETPAAAAAKAEHDAATALYETEAARVRSAAELSRSQEAALEAETAAKAARERTSALEAAAAAR